jgi:hypothetical protein
VRITSSVVLGARVPCLLAAALVACGAPKHETAVGSPSRREAAPAAETAPGPVPSATDSVRGAYWAFVQKLDGRRADVRKVLGPPASSSGDTLRNVHDPAIVDSLVTLRFAGLQIQFFVGAAGGNEFPTLVSTTDSSVRLPLPVGIGSTRAELEHAFGRADFESSRSDSLCLQFAVPGGGNQLVFLLLNDRVRKVEWSYYVD